MSTFLFELQRIPTVFDYYNLLLLGHAALVTLLLSVIGGIIGGAGGLATAVLRRSHIAWLRPLRIAAFLFVHLFRRIPFLITLYIVFFGTQALGMSISPIAVALISISLIGTAYLSEIMRAGLAAVQVNQTEAAQVMNFGALRTLRLVVLPQAWPIILPPAFGYLVLFIKDTALASQIGVLELTDAGKILNDKGLPAFLVYAAVLLIYFLISYPLTLLGSWLERRLAAPRTQSA
jgi:polar amino acid transport system permease protein